ncbi:MAG: HWE histidine kinase domain-containing protein [Gammaproteobacteria bacterium]
MAELRRLQLQQRVMVSELQHRTRNLLAVVRVIACHSFTGHVADDALGRFLERLSSLSRVQAFIGRAEGERVKLADIVRAELEAYHPRPHIRDSKCTDPTVRARMSSGADHRAGAA